MTLAYRTHLHGSIPVLNPGCAHVWQFDATPGAAHECMLAGLLTAAERTQAASMRHSVAREEFVTARTMLRLLLGHYLGRDPLHLPLTKSSKGKLYLADDDLSFNVTHSGGRVLLAFTWQGAIGVDLEAHSAAVDVDALLADAFPASLCEGMQHLNATERQREFFALWTAREAVSKAHGGGLSVPIDWAPVPDLGRSFLMRSATVMGKPFVVVPLTCGESFSGALASCEPFQRTDMLCIKPAVLLNNLLPIGLPSAA